MRRMSGRLVCRLFALCNAGTLSGSGRPVAVPGGLRLAVATGWSVVAQAPAGAAGARMVPAWPRRPRS